MARTRFRWMSAQTAPITITVRPSRARPPRCAAMRCRAMGSIEKPNVARPRRINTSAPLQAPSAIAAAMPRTSNNRPSTIARTIVTARPLRVAHNGVRVSPRAKNAGDRALINTWAGRPSASHISACAVPAVSLAAKAPCSNNSRTTGSLNAINPSVAGRASPIASSRPRDSACVVASLIFGVYRPCQLGHQHRADGDTDDAERQFDQTVGKIEPRHRRGRARGDDRADNDEQLRSGAGDHAGKCLGEKAAHLGIEGHAHRRCEVAAARSRDQNEQLQ